MDSIVTVGMDTEDQWIMENKKRCLEPVKQRSLQVRSITTPVEKSTDWISSLVIVKKLNVKVRICVDSRPLNKALKRSHVSPPTINGILPELYL
jgi:hypothetical protein